LQRKAACDSGRCFCKMQILRDEREFSESASVVALGMFDGVHAGHRALIGCAVQQAQAREAKSVVYTFDRNPLEIVCPSRAPQPLMTLQEKLAAIENIGVDYVIVRRFDVVFADVCAADFLHSIVQNLRPKAIVTGFNYSFGAKGAGNADMIAENAARYGYCPIIVPPVQVDGQTVSSTLIRSLIAMGEWERAQRFL